MAADSDPIISRTFADRIDVINTDVVAPRPLSMPTGTPRWISPELVALTIRTWQPYYQEALTPEVAITIIMNVGRLVDVLGSQTDETLRGTRSGQ